VGQGLDDFYLLLPGGRGEGGELLLELRVDVIQLAHYYSN
jgi:hypothetical protein